MEKVNMGIIPSKPDELSSAIKIQGITVITGILSLTQVMNWNTDILIWVYIFSLIPLALLPFVNLFGLISVLSSKVKYKFGFALLYLGGILISVANLCVWAMACSHMAL